MKSLLNRLAGVTSCVNHPTGGPMDDYNFSPQWLAQNLNVIKDFNYKTGLGLLEFWSGTREGMQFGTNRSV
jgi:hypothetical protein